MTPRNALPDRITTQRITLRAPLLSDLDRLVALANNWNVIEPTASLPFPYRAEHGLGFIERAIHQPERRSYAIADAADRLLGIIGLRFSADRAPELGYWLGEPHWRQGHASAAVTALLDAAQATGRVPAIGARVLAHNAASARVLEKAGFAIIEHTHSTVERHLGQDLLILRWSAP